MAKDLQVTIRVRTRPMDNKLNVYRLRDGHPGYELVSNTNGTGNSGLIEDLRNVGIDLGPQHPCRADGKACGISVDYTAAGTVIKHRLGDRKDRREITDLMRSDVGWAKVAKEALAEMHNNQRGIGPILNAQPLITPYITQEESIDIATQIYEHTGGRVTIPHQKLLAGWTCAFCGDPAVVKHDGDTLCERHGRKRTQ